MKSSVLMKTETEEQTTQCKTDHLKFPLTLCSTSAVPAGTPAFTSHHGELAYFTTH